MKPPFLARLTLLFGWVLSSTLVAQSSPSLPPSSWLKAPVITENLSYAHFPSAAVGTEVSYLIYRPAEYAIESAKHYPVVYWLHGVGGGQGGIAEMVARFDAAIRAKQIPPMLVVYVNGLADSMWADSKDGQVPMETIIIKELIPHIDATYRTIATRQGRLLEGFSMGGFGAARIGFKNQETFGAISLLAGALHDENTLRTRRAQIFQKVFSDDDEYFRSQSPWQLATTHASTAIRTGTKIRQIVGDRDPTLDFNRNYDAHLTTLGIAHSFTVLPGIDHNPNHIYDALGKANWAFYRSAFAPEFSRTRVIGFSQVGQPRGGWFVADGIFESIVGNDHWELLWNGGAGVDRWQDPHYSGWSRPLVSPCPGDTSVDRVLLSVSGPYGNDEAAWVDAINATITTIRQKLPSVKQIVLQAVVGGAGGEPCPAPENNRGRSDSQVRASWQHTPIVNAINETVKRYTDEALSVIAGFHPTVRSCDDYADALGHLKPEGAAAVARTIGEYYAR